MTLPALEAYATDDERLRQVAHDREAVAAAAAQARAALADARRRGDRGSEVRLLGYLGNAMRILGDTDASLGYLRESAGLARELGDERRELIALIRLGETHRCRDEYDDAERVLRDALGRAEAAPALADYVDFALQHLGKALVDRGEAAAAAECLERALAVRRAKGDPELVASTERALERAKGR